MVLLHGAGTKARSETPLSPPTPACPKCWFALIGAQLGDEKRKTERKRERKLARKRKRGNLSSEQHFGRVSSG